MSHNISRPSPSSQEKGGEMVVYSSPGDKQDTVISNSVLQDPNIPFDALGCLVYLLSLPPAWEIKPSVIMEERNIGRDRLRRIMKDLELAGYLKRDRIRNEKGMLGSYRYRLSEVPRLQVHSS